MSRGVVYQNHPMDIPNWRLSSLKTKALHIGTLNSSWFVYYVQWITTGGGRFLVTMHEGTCNKVPIPKPNAEWLLARVRIHCDNKKGKSEGIISNPLISEFKVTVTVRKRPIWVKIDICSQVTLKLDGCPLKSKGHIFVATSCSFHHVITIGEFKLELQSGNA